MKTGEKRNLTTVYWLIAMGCVTSSIVFSGVLLAELLGRDSPLSVSLACLGIVVFLFLLKIQQQDQGTPLITEQSMRVAIAGAVIIEYMVLVAILAFFREAREQLDPLTQTIVGNFTTIVGVVIAFYFGASAYAQKNENKDESKE